MNKNKIRLILSLLLPLTVGTVSALLTRKDMQLYQVLEKPPLSPPAIVFPIAWTLLYVLMGYASYRVNTVTPADTEHYDLQLFKANTYYLVQLSMNFFWSILFFRLKLYLFAFLWLIALYAALILCTLQYFKIEKRAGFLMIPYNLWMTFAAYLNLAAAILNP